MYMIGINDISKRSDLSKVLLKVEEKFRPDLTGKKDHQMPSLCSYTFMFYF